MNNVSNTEKILEFDKIKEIWSSLALTDYAKKEIAETVPLLDEGKLLARQRETTEAKLMLEGMGTPPLTALEGIRELMMAAEHGDCLTAEQLEQAEGALTAVKRLKDYLNRCKQLELSLPWYEENLDELAEIREAIHVQIRGGRVDDYASKLLHSLRSDIIRTEERMKEKADSVIRSNKESMSDSFSVYRSGHLCVPVKKEYKFRISGSVIDKSATGNTLFIEPAAVAKYSEELQLLRIDEENEERRILYTLTAMLGEQGEAMEQNLKTMEKLDFCFSKGKLSMELGCTAPVINTDRRIDLKGARHPLMDRAVCVSQNFLLGKRCVENAVLEKNAGEVENMGRLPQDLNGQETAGVLKEGGEGQTRGGEEYRGVVITGPNTGGKTVAIKTVALNCMMAQCGLHVCCEQADICMNSNYLCDIGDGQNLSENLSTFSAHITNVLDILSKVNRESLQPLYKMVIGEAGESCAFYIAAKLGMPPEMLETAARAAYGKEKDRPAVGVWRDIEDLIEAAAEPHRGYSASPVIQKQRQTLKHTDLSEKFRRGDSVMIYPDKRIGIVCEPVNEKGVLRVQLPEKKIWLNHKRVKLHVPAAELYPEDYDFSIIFDSVETRKLRHKMERMYVEDALVQEPEE